jgi:ribosomal subunit interface protein
MIKLHITSKDLELSERITAYTERKIGRLDRYLPRQMGDLEGRVILEYDQSGREGNQYICEAMIEVPGPNLEARDATLSIFAAIDIVEAKLKAQARKLKQRQGVGRLRRSKAAVKRIFRRDSELI